MSKNTALAALLVLCVTRTVSAATFVVNSPADDVDASPGNGACADAAGVSTSRAAIQVANALAGAETITLPAGTDTLTIARGSEDDDATGDLGTDDDLTINGAAAATTIVDAGAVDRAFEQSSPPRPLSRHPERGA